MSIAYKISGFNRRRKWKIFYSEIKPNQDSTILDVGFNDVEYSETDNFLENNYPFPENITALGINSADNFIKKYPKIKTVIYPGGIFPFANKQFDIGWSNAVLEHVGDNNAQILFLKEINRTCKSAFITTPNKNFPFEVHTRIPLLHFFPKKIFDFFAKLIGKSWATGNYMNLLTLSRIKKLLHQANITNYKILQNKILFFTLDFIIIIK